MADIFLSYAHANGPEVANLVEILRRNGWEVWSDRQLEGGAVYRTAIEKQVQAAGCVIVAWSRHSVGSDWVLDEADAGRKRGVLLPILWDGTEPPMGFRQVQAVADLHGWDGVSTTASIHKLLDEIRRILGPPSASAPADQTAHFEEVILADAYDAYFQALNQFDGMTFSFVAHPPHAVEAGSRIIHVQAGDWGEAFVRSPQRGVLTSINRHALNALLVKPGTTLFSVGLIDDIPNSVDPFQDLRALCGRAELRAKRRMVWLSVGLGVAFVTFVGSVAWFVSRLTLWVLPLIIVSGFAGYASLRKLIEVHQGMSKFPGLWFDVTVEKSVRVKRR